MFFNKLTQLISRGYAINLTNVIHNFSIIIYNMVHSHYYIIYIIFIQINFFALSNEIINPLVFSLVNISLKSNNLYDLEINANNGNKKVLHISYVRLINTSILAVSSSFNLFSFSLALSSGGSILTFVLSPLGQSCCSPSKSSFIFLILFLKIYFYKITHIIITNEIF